VVWLPEIAGKMGIDTRSGTIIDVEKLSETKLSTTAMKLVAEIKERFIALQQEQGTAPQSLKTLDDTIRKFVAECGVLLGETTAVAMPNEAESLDSMAFRLNSSMSPLWRKSKSVNNCKHRTMGKYRHLSTQRLGHYR